MSHVRSEDRLDAGRADRRTGRRAPGQFIAGVKDSAGDWFEDQVLLLRPRRQGFAIFQENQVYAGVSLLAGADGLVPGHANIWPDLLAEMYDAARRKEIGPVWQA